MSHLAKDMTPSVTWKDITPGCNIFEGATSVTVETGDWRTIKPVIDWDKCKQCLLCAPVCPLGVMEFYTVEETAVLLKTSKQQIRKMIRAGFLPAVKVGREWRVASEYIREFLKENSAF